jgi:ion channel-forming bestrophin family protein
MWFDAKRAYENPTEGHSFWRDALAWGPAITGHVFPRIALFGLYAAAVALLHGELRWGGIAISHVQYTAGFLALLLVLRTNAGYERWWEARKLWGGIVNQSRNLVISGLAYAGQDPEWRGRFVRWSAAFCHVARLSLRSERNTEDLERVLGTEDAAAVVAAQHMPSYVARRIGELLREARDQGRLDAYAFLQVDRERASLIDHIGGCERILKTPLPRVHSIKLRRFILLYMLGLPFAMGTSSVELAVLATCLVAYPLFAIDRIAQELESPFSPLRQSHLPLDGICRTIEGNLLALGEGVQDQSPR